MLKNIISIFRQWFQQTLSEEDSNLKSENEILKEKIESFNSQLASASSSDLNTANNSSQETTRTAAVKEVFHNCTDLRGTYPSGVPAGHPAYVPSMTAIKIITHVKDDDFIEKIYTSLGQKKRYGFQPQRSRSSFPLD